MSPPVSGTGIAVVTDRLWSLRVFYKLLNSHAEESVHLDGVWRNQQLAFTPVNDTPLAAITYSGGKQIRVYYLDTNHMIQEYCYTNGQWYQGVINTLGVKAATGSGLAATAYGVEVHGVGEAGVHIRVFYQDATTNKIEELAHDGGSWYKGKLAITDAIGAAGVTATAYYLADNTHIRLYYQARDLGIYERGWRTDRGWFGGGSSLAQATAHTPLACLAFGNLQLQVYFRNPKGQVAYVKYTGGWRTPIIITSIGPGFNLAVLEWDTGNRLRLYYQEFSGALAEHCSDDGGNTWFLGKFHIAGE